MRTKIILYPCASCTTWNVEEWYYDDEPGFWPKLTKNRHCREFDTIDAAREHYRPIIGELVESIYDSKTDSYSNPNNPTVNFVVQGSHGRCWACQKLMEAL
jgi:hypothetical protein